MESTHDTSALSGPALREAKRALRERVLAARDALDPSMRAAASVAIAQRIAALPSFLGARMPLLTLPFRSEWDTRPLLDASLANGGAVVLPRVNEATRMLELHLVSEPAWQIRAGYRGIPEPDAATPQVDPADVDWVLVPGVAFDASGGRLGYGGGFYDRLLPLLPRATPRIAGAFDVQVVEAVPAAPHDLRVHAIATPGGLVVPA
ncbi:MAG: 5-formyltetrahydrofolate cyclo-ligase [Burkholderiales bacterium]